MAIAEEYLGIAILDDDDVYRDFVSAVVSRESKFRVFGAASGDALDRILATETIDCILLDYHLGEENAFAIKDHIVRQYASVPPIIMLTGDGRESTVIKALRMGIDDYLPKRDLQASALVASIVRVVQKDRDEKRAKAEYQRLVQASEVDVLTGLPSRTQLEERLSQIVSMGSVARSCYALVVIELAEWKAIVDRFGLSAGDQALRKFTERLRAVARATDTLGRCCENIFLVIAEVGHDKLLLQDIRERFLDQLTFRLDMNVTSVQISARVEIVGWNDIDRDGVAPSGLIEEAIRAVAAVGGPVGPLEDDGRSSPVNGKPPEPRDGAAAGSLLGDSGSHQELRTSDRRKETRQRVLKRGQILIPTLGAAIDCTVRNLSPHGAGLRVDSTFAPPSEFELSIAGDGTRRKVQVRWQVGRNFGVEYLD